MLAEISYTIRAIRFISDRGFNSAFRFATRLHLQLYLNKSLDCPVRRYGFVDKCKIYILGILQFPVEMRLSLLCILIYLLSQKVD